MINKYVLTIKENLWISRLQNKVPISYLIVLLFSCTFIQMGKTQTSLKDLRGVIEEKAREKNVDLIDLAELRITDQYVSKKSQIENIYFCQQYKGIDIANSAMSIHLTKAKEILKINTQFEKNLKGRINSLVPSISAVEAIKVAAKELGLAMRNESKVIEQKSNQKYNFIYSAADISSKNIRPKLIFTNNKDGHLILVWNFKIYELNNDKSWNLKIDARSGLLVEKINLTMHCNHWNYDTSYNQCTEDDNFISLEKNENHVVAPAAASSYNVFPFPIESPVDGVRNIVIDPDDPLASPFGWHDTNGVAGAEFTDTRGNNVDVFEEGNNPMFRPDGGPDLNFNFPLDLSDPENSEAANLTNTFYWCNLNHDVFYSYGFDEASGNLQVNNYSNDGLANDPVIVKTQVAYSCFASISLTEDGISPEINVGICEDGPGVQDGTLSNVIITHEYAHALTSRLLGGPSNADCYSYAETMREGWSDWYSLVFTIKPTDTRFDDRYYASWFHDNPLGDRPNPYSLDFSINDHTYDSIADFFDIQVHSTGSVWAIMLWELTWDLIDTYGFDPNLLYGTGGNNIALAIVTEGVKLSPCKPGFVDARDGILAADQALNGGANQCLIWKAFARRGLGLSAYQGSVYSLIDGNEAFDYPVECECIDDLILNGYITSSINQASITINSAGIINSGSEVTFFAGQQIRLNPGFQAQEGSDFRAFINPCTMFAPDNDPAYARLSDYSATTIITEEESLIKTNGLINIENYPNPFEEKTTFKIELENESLVQLTIFDIAGKLIATPIDQTLLSAGIHLLEYENRQLPNGIYYYRLSTKNGIVTKKMIINK